MSQYQSDISDEAGLALAFFAPSAPLIPGNRTMLCTLVDHTRTNRLADHKPPQVMPDCACK